MGSELHLMELGDGRFSTLLCDDRTEMQMPAMTPADETLLVCKKLRDRMYSRLLRWQDAAPSERANLLPMDYEQYDQWSENARLAREEYVQGKLTAGEFLRKIDTIHELTSYEVDKIDLPDEPSLWQRLVERDFRFDPERHFPEEKAHLILGVSNPQWQILTADDQRREAQKGYQSLKEKYGKRKSPRGHFIPEKRTTPEGFY